MATLYTQQSKNVRRTWLFMTLFIVIIVGLGWFFSYYLGNPAIFYFAVVLSVVMNIGSYWYSDKIVLALTHARQIKKEDDPELWDITENLAITAGLPMPRLYIVDDPAPNAFATGRDKQHAAVAVTSGLRSLLEKSELEGVIAHELSHVGNRDILISTIVVVLAGMIMILSDFFLRFGGFYGGRREGQGNQAQAILLLIGIVIAILSPIIAMLIRFAVSRRREFLADADGALLTRYPEGLASALRKISGHAERMKTASNATAHLFIASPFGARAVASPSFIQKLFMDHPPVKERIKALLGDHADG